MGGEQLRRKKKLRKAAFQRQGGKCYWCGCAMIYKTQENAHELHENKEMLSLMCTADHVTQRSIGGKTSKDNIVAACFGCNTRRHATYQERGLTYIDGFPVVPYCPKEMADEAVESFKRKMDKYAPPAQ